MGVGALFSDPLKVCEIQHEICKGVNMDVLAWLGIRHFKNQDFTFENEIRIDKAKFAKVVRFDRPGSDKCRFVGR